jgi:FtsP/CotA-like multicopper oxidase with cupredoxin domain
MSRRQLRWSGALFTALLCTGIWLFTSASGSIATTRRYYVAAEEVVWDYAPTGTDLISGQPFDAVQKPFMEAGPKTIGRKYLKALYREYTDSTFTTLKPRPPQWEHLGFLGPLIRAEVGDTIRIVFRNKTRHPVSMHPHGVFYNKDSEGAPYADKSNAADKKDDGVPTGGTHLYVWPVPERAGPGRGDPNSVFWMYHSHTHEVFDVNSGLVGPMIVTARGQARSDGSPRDTDRELIVAFAEVDENNSYYLVENMKQYMTMADSFKVDTTFGAQGVSKGAGQFNFKETLNGYSFGHLPMLTVREGERVRWYIMASTNFEFHAPHWHGNVVEIGHMRTDVTSLTPMEMVTAEMVPDNPGVWLFHCHLSNHLLMGMQGRFEVLPRTTAAR